MTVQTYEPRGGAVELLKARDGMVLISGAAGTGKSLAALQKTFLTAMLVPGSRHLILRQTQTSLTATTLQTFERFVIANAIAAGAVTWFGGSARKPAAYNFHNGSQIYVGGLDNPGKLLSLEIDRCFVDEANQVSETAIQIISTRLRGNAPTYKQLVMACNPDHPSHHLYTMCMEGRARMIHSLHKDNPYLMDKDGNPTEIGRGYLARLQELTGVRRARYYEGRWVAAEGLVYDAWREADNVIDRSKVPKLDYRFWSIDWGYSNPFVWQEWGVDHDGRMYLLREIHKTRTLVEDHARYIKSIVDYRPTAIVCDHDAEDRATLERHLGLPTVPARKAVSKGVQLMQARIRPAGDGKPRLFVVRDSLLGRDDVAEAEKRPRGLLGEITGYVWQTERGSDGIPKEAPLKQNDHSADAARYAVAHLDWHEPARVGNPAAAQPVPPGQGSVWSRPVGR